MSHFISIRDGMDQCTEKDLMHFANDFIAAPGIVGTGAYKVEAQETPDMTVKVNTGEAYVWSSTLNTFLRTELDASVNVTIDANTSGSTRHDIICIKIDTSATPDAEASNVASCVAVKGTPGAGVPSTPANHYKLAEVEVIDQASSIPNAKITDKRSGVDITIPDRLYTDIIREKTSGVGVTIDGLRIIDGGLAGDVSGWVNADETWVYVSTTSFKVEGVDVRAKYPKGTKIRYKQGGSYEYAYVIGTAFSTDTTVTITGGSDYALADAAITANYYSYQGTPQGFPDWFDYNVTWTQSTSSPSLENGILAGRFRLDGQTCHFRVYLKIGSTTSMGEGQFGLGVPIISADNLSNGEGGLVSGVLRDSGTKWYIVNSSVVAGGASMDRICVHDNLDSLTETIPMTWTTGDFMNIGGFYEIA